MIRKWWRRRRQPFDWWRECPELRQWSHVHVIQVGRKWVA